MQGGDESAKELDAALPKITPIEAAERFAFIEEALSAGASVGRLSARAGGGDWTVVTFENAQGTYLLKGEDVYVTRASVEEVYASIKADPITLPGLADLGHVGEIEIEAPDRSFSELLASMEANNRDILEAALNGGAVVDRFWSAWSEANPERCAMAIVSFENDPNTYIFDNHEGTADRTKLDFGATRYAVDFGYVIGDLTPVHEIEGEANQVEQRSLDYSWSL